MIKKKIKKFTFITDFDLDTINNITARFRSPGFGEEIHWRDGFSTVNFGTAAGNGITLVGNVNVTGELQTVGTVKWLNGNLVFWNGLTWQTLLLTTIVGPVSIS